MIRICQYCKQVMGEKEPPEDKTLTHSICPTCMPQHLVDWGMGERSFNA